MSSEIDKNLAILGLRPGAKQIEIKNAFKNLTHIYHPDISETDTTEKYREILEAYENLFDEKLYKEEMEKLKKNPKEYHQARAKYPLVFVDDDGRTSGKNTTNPTNTTSNKPVPTSYTKNQKKKTTKTSPPKKKDNNGSDIVPFCIGGAVVAAIIALFSFPPLLIIIIIALGAYWLLK